MAAEVHLPPVGYQYNGREYINRLEHLAALSSQELATVHRAEQQAVASGMTDAAIATWFNEAVTSARGDSREQSVLTAGLMMRTFVAGVRRGTIGNVKPEQQDQWISRAREVFTKILIPRLRRDFEEAILFTDGTVHKTYGQVLDLMASPDRRQLYRTFAIVVRSTYQGNAASDLAPERVVELRKQWLESNGRVVDGELLAAVKKCLVVYKELRPRYALSDFIEYSRTGIGDREMETAYAALQSELVRVGYSRQAVADALVLLASGAP